MCLRVSYKETLCKILIFFAALKSLKKKEPDPELDPDPLVRGADPDQYQNIMDPHVTG
jgi:hypothetical protein